MNILITGAKGFVGKNLTVSLQNIKDGKDKTHSEFSIGELYLYDIDTDPSLLASYCEKADFVFNLAGANRPKEQSEFMTRNFGFASTLLDTLKAAHNTCPVMLSSSIQASQDNPYGKSKKSGEELFFQYAIETGAKVCVYRFPNIFGKWCRPNYNSAVVTFCNNIANDLPITVNDRSVVMKLVYIDDVVNELIDALSYHEHHSSDLKRGDGQTYCCVPTVHTITLGEIVDLIYSFKASRDERSIPNMSDSFTKKLYATYLSYLPKDGFGYDLKMNIDKRGSFTEIIRTQDRGQFSVNISHPGITKGQHWHHTKNEKFLVVTGKGVIRFKNAMPEADQSVIEYFVTGAKLQIIDTPPGYTHNIENLGDADMITFMWCCECFDPNKPDTYYLGV